MDIAIQAARKWNAEIITGCNQGESRRVCVRYFSYVSLAYEVEGVALLEVVDWAKARKEEAKVAYLIAWLPRRREDTASIRCRGSKMGDACWPR